jgi:formamidopyrimidine-DNA glycosylase
MADEILWQARMNPRRLTGGLDRPQIQQLWRQTRMICRLAVQSIVEHEAEPPKSWLFHQRWSRNGKCPRDNTPLKRATIAGRTTAWCPRCQA